jgi:hypothetical protein
MESNYNIIFRHLCRDLRVNEASYDATKFDAMRRSFLQLTDLIGGCSSRACALDLLAGFPEYEATLLELTTTFGPRLALPSTQDPVDYRKAIGIWARDVNQLLAFGLRQHVQLSQSNKERYVENFIKNEEDCAKYRVSQRSAASRLAKSLVRRACSELDLSAAAIAANGRHGPGAVFDGEEGLDKNIFVPPPARQLAKSYSDEFFFSNELLAYECELRDGPRSPRKDYNESRLVLVPKDYKGPRGVFVSSKEAMFCQLAQRDALVKAFKGSWVSTCYDGSDQTLSHECVCSGVVASGDPCVTLDLKDASDRIPLSLVAYLFHRQDYIALARTRPSYVWMPNGTRHKLRMFAPMGDGKTFEVLSLVCTCLTVAAILIDRGYVVGQPLSLKDIIRAARCCRVYGDDIIVARQYASSVIAILEAHNLKVNSSKSFLRGNFRESCGLEVLGSLDITPLRVSRGLDVESVTHENVLQLVNLHNRCLATASRLNYTVIALRAIIDGSRAGRKVGLTSRCDLNPYCLWIPGGWMNHSLSRDKDAVLVPLSKVERPTDSGQINGLFPHLTKNYFLEKMRECRYLTPNLEIIGLASRRLGNKSVRFNDHLQRWELRCLSPRSIEYAPSSDPWWDMNMAIRVGPSPVSENNPWRSWKTQVDQKRTCVGSPITSTLVNEWRRRAGLSEICVNDRCTSVT